MARFQRMDIKNAPSKFQNMAMPMRISRECHEVSMLTSPSSIMDWILSTCVSGSTKAKQRTAKGIDITGNVCPANAKAGLPITPAAPVAILMTPTTPTNTIPAPEQALEFGIDAAGKTAQEVLSEAVLHTYDVRRDSDALRAAPSDFERLRGDYWVRREPSAFTLALRGGSPDLASRLEMIGFKVNNI